MSVWVAPVPKLRQSLMMEVKLQGRRSRDIYMQNKANVQIHIQVILTRCWHKASFIFEMGSYRSRTPPVSQNCDNHALKMLSEIDTRDVG